MILSYNARACSYAVFHGRTTYTRPNAVTVTTMFYEWLHAWVVLEHSNDNLHIKTRILEGLMLVH